MADPIRLSRGAQGNQSGLTLIEVIVAIALIGIVSSAAISFFIRGVATVSDQQRRQAAVTLANSAIDVARSVEPSAVDGGTTSGLVKGRSSSAVATAWNAATVLNPTDTADMNQVSDPGLAVSISDQWVPITTTRVVDKQTYTVTTLVGTCFRPKEATSASAKCTKTKAEQGGSDVIMMYRVRAVVTWAENDTATPHSYRLATLIDPSVDIVWNTVLKPFAYDDEVTISAGDPAEFYAIVANDQVDYNTEGSTSPIVDLTLPKNAGGTVYGTAVIGSGDKINGIIYTPPADATLAGTVTLTYAVRGTSLEKSTPATVTIHILPRPIDDSFRRQPGSDSVLNDTLLSNDYGKKNIDASRTVRFVLASNPDVDMFSAVVSEEIRAARELSERVLTERGLSLVDGKVHFKAPEDGTTEPVVFYYYLVDEALDRAGQGFPSVKPARVVIDVVEEEPKSEDITITIPIAPEGADLSTDLEMQDITDNPANYKIKITGTNIGDGAQGRLEIDGDNYNPADHNTGLDIIYKQQGNSPHIAWFTYVVVSPGGKVSEEHKITLHIVATTKDDTYEVKKGSQTDLVLIANDRPSDATSRLFEVSALPANCGSMSIIADGGKVTYKAPNKTGTCTFTYKLQATSFPELVSEEATVTIKVVN